jgi:hypothetical protein
MGGNLVNMLESILREMDQYLVIYTFQLLNSHLKLEGTGLRR